MNIGKLELLQRLYRGDVWFNRHSLTGAICGRAKPPGPNPWTRVAWLQVSERTCIDVSRFGDVKISVARSEAKRDARP